MLREFVAPFRFPRPAVLIVAVLAATVAGCGIRGPLRLPPKPATGTAPPGTAAPAAGALPTEPPAAIPPVTPAAPDHAP
jgi:predicted small lipoprotein YifL